MICQLALLALLGLAGTSTELPASIGAAIDRVSWTPDKVVLLIERMPKAELHLHLDGTLTPELIQTLARQQGHAPLAGKSLEEIRNLTVVDEARSSLAAVLEVFEVFLPLLRHPDAVERLAYDLARRARGQNILYFEARFAPVLLAGAEATPEDALEAALRGLRRGEQDFGVASGVIVSLIRPFDLVSLEENEAMLELALRYRERGVVGLDLAGNEAALGLQAYRRLFVEARQAGLRLTVHAGEVPDSGDLEIALELEVDRLGHATLLRERPELRREVARRGIAIEVNPTSNLRTGAIDSYSAHPARQWLDQGLRLVLGSDDPGVFDIDLVHEYRVLAESLGFGPHELVAVSLASVEAAFLDPVPKRLLRQRFEEDLARLLADLASR